KVYYDPTITYTPPPKADGTSYYTNYSWENGYRITSIPMSGVNLGEGNRDITQFTGEQHSYSDSFPFYTSFTTGSGKNKKTWYYFTFAVGPVSTSQTVYYLASEAQGCQPGLANCVTEDALDIRFSPAGVRAGTNVANW